VCRESSFSCNILCTSLFFGLQNIVSKIRKTKSACRILLAHTWELNELVFWSSRAVPATVVEPPDMLLSQFERLIVQDPSIISILISQQERKSAITKVGEVRNILEEISLHNELSSSFVGENPFICELPIFLNNNIHNQENNFPVTIREKLTNRSCLIRETRHGRRGYLDQSTNINHQDAVSFMG
jgi:hypothetical protein